MRTTAGIVCAGLCIGALWYGARQPPITIATVRIEGAGVSDTETLERAVTDILSGNYFFIFPRRNFFLYPKKTITRSLLDSFKRLETVSVAAPDFKTLVVTVVERTPRALWCGETLPEETVAEAPPCYFLDESGFLFAEAPSFTGDLYVMYYGAIGKGGPVGQRLLSPERFHAVDSFLTSVRTLGLSPVVVGLDARDGTVRLKQGSTILFSLTDDFRRTLQNLQSFLAGNTSAVSRTNLPVEAFSSVDLRFGDKIFFKRK